MPINPDLLQDPLSWDIKTLTLLEVGDTFRSTLTTDTDYAVGLEYNERAHRLAAKVLQEHLVDDYYHTDVVNEWPATTWQMFKHRHEFSWWLGWLVRRRPVRMQVNRQRVMVEVGRYLNYPEANVPIDKRLGRPIPYETLKEL